MIFEKLDFSESSYLARNNTKSPVKMILQELIQKNTSKILVRKKEYKNQSKLILKKRSSPNIINLNLPFIPSLPVEFHRNEELIHTKSIRRSDERLMSEYFRRRRIVFSKIQSHLN